jgi:hypothetical protein
MSSWWCFQLAGWVSLNPSYRFVARMERSEIRAAIGWRNFPLGLPDRFAVPPPFITAQITFAGASSGLTKPSMAPPSIQRATATRSCSGSTKIMLVPLPICTKALAGALGRSRRLVLRNQFMNP